VLSAREIGVPIGEGIGLGVVRGLNGFIQGDGAGKIVDTLEQLLKTPEIQALLATIEKAEGGGLNVMAGGRRVNSGALHPGEVVPSSQWFRSSKGASSAAGLFQITRTNWRRLSGPLGLSNFSDPHQQELAALAIMAGHPGGLQALQSGDLNQMRALAAKDWTSTPGSRIGGGGQWSMNKWAGAYQGFLAGGKPIDAANPMPVYVAKDIEGGAAQLLRSMGSGGGGNGKGFSPWLDSLRAFIAQQDSAEKVINDTVPVLVNVTSAMDALKTTSAADSMATSIQMKTTRDLIPIQMRSAEETASLTEQMRELGNAAIIGNDAVSRIASTFLSVSGMIPSQQVGKKRSLFSKILGFAAPFLSFIPGAGPILSTIAGAASSAIGGNYGAAASTIAGGFQAGGVFRSSSGGGSHSDGSHAAGLPFVPFNNYRANLHYGERVLTARENQMLASGGNAGLSEAVDRLHSLLSRLESMPAHEVVRIGARGLVSAMDSDADMIRLTGQRLRLA
jgi:muramidase (phage lysozyme)